MKLGVCPSSEGKNIYPFENVFDDVLMLYSPAQVAECDAVILWGGTDIAPMFYGEQPHPMNQQQKGPSQRDVFEWSIMRAAESAGVPIIGICRGAQFICAFAGGKLVQHMGKSHHGSQRLDVHDLGMPASLTASCDHHQCMNLSEECAEPYIIRASALDGTPEVVSFPNIRALAVQPHPEWMASDEPFVEWIVSLVKQLVVKE